MLAALKRRWPNYTISGHMSETAGQLINWPTAVAGEADSVRSVSSSACHIGGPIAVNPGELALVYGK